MNGNLTQLQKLGWHIGKPNDATIDLHDVHVRYGGIPAEYESFIENYTVIENTKQNAWFLTKDDYAGVADSAFCWNEFERISLDSVIDLDDETEITRFWDQHFPISLSLVNGYAYLAIRLSDHGIVMGNEPEFECCSFLFANFDSMLAEMISCINGQKNNPYLSQYWNL